MKLDDSEDCWAKVLKIYSAQVKFWIRKKLSSASKEDLDDLVQDAFFRFYKYYTANRFAAANHGLASIMSFLRLCAESSVMDEIRRRGSERQLILAMANEILDGWDEDWEIDDGVYQNLPQPVMAVRTAPDADIENKIWLDQVWMHLYGLVRNDKERIIVELTFSEGLMSRHIFGLHPNLFKDLAQVSAIKRELFTRLQQDSTLRALLDDRPTIY